MASALMLLLSGAVDFISVAPQRITDGTLVFCVVSCIFFSLGRMRHQLLKSAIVGFNC